MYGGVHYNLFNNPYLRKSSSNRAFLRKNQSLLYPYLIPNSKKETASIKKPQSYYIFNHKLAKSLDNIDNIR